MLYTFLPLLNPNFAVFPTFPCNNKVPSPNSGPVDAVVVGGAEAVLLPVATRVVISIKLVGLAAGKEEDREDGDAVDLIEAETVYRDFSEMGGLWWPKLLWRVARASRM